MQGIVAIVGRPNVGKSTLFNRMVESRQAIVDDQAGVTRDRNMGVSEWNGRSFMVVDTGGYVPASADLIDSAIREQVEIALAEADVVIFMVDVRDGLSHVDDEILQVIRQRGNQRVVLAANKADNYSRELHSAEFYALGMDEVFAISAMSGSGTGELLDRVAALLPDEVQPTLETNIPRIAIVGRPNVGKSSLVNALIGRNQHIVTPIAGTTRDSIATRYQAFGFDMYLVDTAGLRRKARVRDSQDNLELYSTMRTIRAIQECDVAMLLLDAQNGIEAQDLAILHLIEKHRKGMVIAVNKWDLVEKDKNVDKKFEAKIAERIAPLSGVPVVFISALEKLRIHKALQTLIEVYQSGKRKIPTREINDTLLPYIAQTPPPSERGRIIRIKFITQVEGGTPTFLFFCNHPKFIKESYVRFLEGKIRLHFGFQGWPINVFFREK